MRNSLSSAQTEVCAALPRSKPAELSKPTVLLHPTIGRGRAHSK